MTVALAVRTGMVNREQVYSPSSDSCTSEMVMESSVGVERCSWIRLSLRAEARRHRKAKVRRTQLIFLTTQTETLVQGELGLGIGLLVVFE